MNKTPLFRHKWVKVLVVVFIVLVVAYIIPIPEVGKPVEEIAKEGKFIEVEGVKVYYVEKGEGDITFILLHGFGASVFSWRYVIDDLARYGRVVAFDRPGFGLTERVSPWKTSINPYTVDGSIEITCKLAEALNTTRVVLIGHSMGGGLALLASQRCSFKVDALVLIAPAWKPSQRNILNRLLFSIPYTDKYGPLVIRGMVGQLEQVLYRAWYNKSKLTSDVIEGYKYPLNAENWDKGLYWIMKYYEFPDVSSILSRINIPVLIVHGRQDEIVPLSSSIELKSKLVSSSVELVVIDECGHLPHEEKPEEFLEALRCFLEKQGIIELRD